MNLITQNVISKEQYFSYCEKYQNEKFEFFDGKIHVMGNTSFNHDLIKSGLISELDSFFKNSGMKCRAVSEAKLNIGDNYFIPDVMVVCKQNNEFSYEPIIIIEVLSPSTKNVDFGRKFQIYKTLETLQEYLVIEQDEMRAYLFSKKDNWKAIVCQFGDNLYFESLGFSMAFEDVYRDVTLKNDLRIMF